MGELNKVKPEKEIANFQPETTEEGVLTDYDIPSDNKDSTKTESEVAPSTDVPKDQVEKDLEEKVLTKKFIVGYTENYLIDLTKRSYIGPSEFLVYKHTGRNMLYFLKRINPEEKDAKYKLHMCVPASNNIKN